MPDSVVDFHRFTDGPLAGQPLRCRLELVKIEPQTPNWEIKTTDLKIEAVNSPRGNQSPS